MQMICRMQARKNPALAQPGRDYFISNIWRARLMERVSRR